MTLELEPAPERPPLPRPPRTPRRRFVRPPEDGGLLGRVRGLPRSFVLSVLAHVFLFLVLAWLLWREPPDAPAPVTVSVEWLRASAADPEAEAGGRDLRTETAGAKGDVAGRDAGDSIADEARNPAFGAGGGGVASAFAGRVAGRDALRAAGGGDDATDGALRAALDWLARHQDPDGAWNGMKFPARCAAGGPRCGGPAEREYAAGCTSLALLAFLGAGHTHREGEWMPVVARGFDALLRMQRKDGSFATDEKRAYASAIAAAALAEGAGMTGSPRLRAAAERAVGYFVARQAETGGWRYDPGDGAADTSVTSWVSLALASARKSGIVVPDATVAGARAWIARVRGDDGSVGYLGRAGGYPSLLGAAMFADVALGGDADARENRATAALLLRHLPRIARDDADGGSSFGAADPMHWYHGSLAAFQAGGAVWERWHERLRPVLLGTQEVSGDARGSYPPSGSSGRHGGRVVTTALCALSLEIYWRYPRATLR